MNLNGEAAVCPVNDPQWLKEKVLLASCLVARAEAVGMETLFACSFAMTGAKNDRSR